jgi:hypothetical protein
LLAVDFDQLKIENKQCLAKMEEQKHELLESKTVADAAQRELNIYKVYSVFKLKFESTMNWIRASLRLI